MSNRSGTSIAWLVVLAGFVTLLTNAIVKHWQRWLRHVGLDKSRTFSPWEFTSAFLRQAVAYGVETEKSGQSCDKSVVRGRLKELVSAAERWAIRHDERPATDEHTFRGFLKLQGSCAAFSVLEVLLCVCAKLILYAYAALRACLSSELRTFEASRLGRVKRVPPRSATDKVVRIVYVRHGESMWNRAFNHGLSLRSIVRILTLLLWEFCLLGDLDSVILDAPLSSTGVSQAVELQAWLNIDAQTADREARQTSPTRLLHVIKSSHARGRLQFMVSNLRRAISTLAITFGDLVQARQRTLVTSSLQEVTRNPDSISLTAKGGANFPSAFEAEAVPWDLPEFYARHIDWSSNGGNRGLRSRLELRLEEFAHVVHQLNVDRDIDTVVVCGHSLWLKAFLLFYASEDQEVKAQNRKISNCGIVSFDLQIRRPNDEVRLLATVMAIQRPSKRPPFLQQLGPFFVVDASSVELHRGRYL